MLIFQTLLRCLTFNNQTNPASRKRNDAGFVNKTEVALPVSWTAVVTKTGRARRFALGLLLGIAVASEPESASAFDLPESSDGFVYTNQRIATVPWSIHIVRFERARREFELHSTHGRQSALGLGTLTAQTRAMNPEWGQPVAAVNGDFYQRGQMYVGDPRGIQIMEGEIISAPIGGVGFWVDADQQPHTTNIGSLFQVTWPNGMNTRFGLNEDRS